MNQQDKSFVVTFVGIMTVLVLLAVAIFLISRGVSVVVTDPLDPERKEATALDRIRPVGQVVVAQAVAPGQEAPPKSGEEVVASACAACHQAGVLQAPKIGAAEDWQPRMEQGMDTLVQNAINGINAMPARGGDPNLSDEEIHNAVVHMLAQSGIDVEAGGAAQTAQAEPAAEQPAAQAEQPAAAPSEPAAAPATASAGHDLAKGEEVYNGICMACHMAGVLQAPKTGDNAVWSARYDEKGFDTLVHNAINGINAMPPKGGNPSLSDEDISHSVAFMLVESGIELTAAGAGGGEAAAAEAQPAAAEGEPAAAEGEATAGTEAQAAGEAREPMTGPSQVEPFAGQESVPTTPSQGSQPPAQTPPADITSESAAPAQEGQTQQPQAEAEAAPAQDEGEAQQAQAQPEQTPDLTQEQAQAAAQAAQESEPQAQAQQPAPPAPAPAQRSSELTEGSQVAMAGGVKEMQAGIQIPEDVDMARGRQLYNTACIICHEQGVAGAPKLDDKGAWAPRLEKGFDTLLHNAINGYKAMPPKGGSMDVPDEDIEAAVAFMAQEAQ